MKITEVENMNAADLKSRRAELVQEMEKLTVRELAGRYVQARTDAKMRDETLAGQGTTITSLNEALAAAKASASEVKQRWDADHNALTANLEEVTESGRKALAEVEAKWEAERTALKASTEYADKLAQQLAAEKQGRATVLALAKGRRAVLAQISTLIVPLLAAE